MHFTVSKLVSTAAGAARRLAVTHLYIAAIALAWTAAAPGQAARELLNSERIEAILGYRGRTEMVHRDDLVMAGE